MQLFWLQFIPADCVHVHVHVHVCCCDFLLSVYLPFKAMNKHTHTHSVSCLCIMWPKIKCVHVRDDGKLQLHNTFPSCYLPLKSQSLVLSLLLGLLLQNHIEKNDSINPDHQLNEYWTIMVAGNGFKCSYFVWILFCCSSSSFPPEGLIKSHFVLADHNIAR